MHVTVCSIITMTFGISVCQQNSKRYGTVICTSLFSIGWQLYNSDCLFIPIQHYGIYLWIASNLLLSDIRIFWNVEFLFHEDSQFTDVWKYCGVYTILHSLSEINYKIMLRCLEYMCPVSSPLRRHGLLIRSHL